MTLQDILDALPRYRAATEACMDIALAHVALIGEIPAPTGREAARVRMAVERFAECGLDETEIDPAGNAVAVVRGRRGDRRLLVLAHADTPTPDEGPRDVQIMEDTVSGVDLADNGLGLAMLATLPCVLDALDLRLRADLVLLADVRSLNHGNLAGLHAFLEAQAEPFAAAAAIEGAELGRLSFATAETIRGLIVCRPDGPDGGSLWPALAETIRAADACAAERREQAAAVIGRIAGGNSFGRPVGEVSLQFELRSATCGPARALRAELERRCAAAAGRHGASCAFRDVSTRACGGLDADHPLPRCVRRIHRALGLTTREIESSSELSALVERGIPAVTLGMAEGIERRRERDVLGIPSLAAGMAQLIALLQALDEDVCHES